MSYGVGEHMELLREMLDGWEPGKLTELLADRSRGKSKSIFRDLYMGRPALTGMTTNTIVMDEIGEPGAITIDRLDKMMAMIERPVESSSIWWNDWPELGQIPKMEEVGGKWIYLSDVKASFKDEEFPEAHTYLVLEKLDKKDPRHPNPAAGSQKHWFVLQGHKRIQVKNRTQGEARAKAMHLQVIEGTKKRREQAELDAAIAVEQARLEAERNAQHLKAHPAFGGF